MAVTAADVKKLREKTGAGMMDCKKALVEADGNFEKAERILKELGKAAAAKRSGRATNQGRIFIQVQDAKAAILELSCETDFVARNENFVKLGNELALDALKRGATSIDEPMKAKVQDAISTIKENMEPRRLTVIERGNDEIFSSYIHGDAGNMGAVVRVKADRPEALETDEVKGFAFDCALHAVAFQPLFLSADSVDAAYKEEQEQIFTTQAQNLGKPEKVLQGIVQGKMRKHYSEVCFLEQAFVKDDKLSVSQVAKNVGKSVGAGVTVSGYVVFVVGQE